MTLFDPLEQRGLRLRNRLVVSPMCQYSATDGLPDDWHLVHLGSRAVGGAAVVMAEATAVSAQGRISPGDTGLWNEAQQAAWQPITRFIKAQGAIAGVQLAHAGRKASALRPWEGHGALPAGQGDWPTVAPSALPFDAGWPAPQALDAAGIRALVEDFRTAAQRALAAGFELVELHAAHGYLLHQFLSPLSNQRTDDYGGSIENRARFLFEVVDAIAGEIGAGRTAIRISPVTPANDAFDPDPQPLFTHVVEGLARHGLAYIHVIEGATGGARDHQQGDRPFDYAALHAAYRAAGGTAGWMVNNGYDRALALDAVSSGKADLVAFGKLFIANPDLVKRLKDDLPLNAPDKDTFYGGGAKGYTDYPALENVA